MREFKCINNCCVLIYTEEKRERVKEVSFSSDKAGIVVYDGGKILLSQSYNGKWGIPKGTVNIGESKLVAAARELKEETSIYIKNLISLKSYTDYQISGTNYRIYTIPYRKCAKYDIEPEGADSTGSGFIGLECLKECVKTKAIKINLLTKIVLDTFKWEIEDIFFT